MNINNFISSINKNGVARTNRFSVSFNLPTYLNSNKNEYGFNDKLISYRCESAQLPGLALATVDGPPRLGYGAMESMPYNVTYDDLSLTFLMDSSTKLHKLFYDWMNCIVNFQGSHGQGSWNKSDNRFTKAAAYEVGYKVNYRTDIVIDVYDTNDNHILTGTAYNAFPKILPSTDLAWSDQDALMKYTIPFSYTDFNTKYHRINVTK